ncbi:hypothetical protein KJS94_18090 [Flavihumibacter rivuli]|uniref:hypothetical protein n=1 Tax=Flavihumibacter rivuli TaxID=2838156 RepID=UPI001BDE36FE|nr:hypothetical protein [Flavihumibacter rivuli]ULQ56566.1 hypothetical protein KJS94_18090 [Flavihumibacter rivuli]
MIGIFRQKNPGNALVLLIYALILKFPLFLHAKVPLRQEDDNYLYKVLLDFLENVGGKSGFLYPLLAFLVFYLQASLFNRMTNSVKLFPKPGYLVGMSYLLVTSLLPEWNQFSSTLIVNFLLVWIWYGMVRWYNSNKPMAVIFNTCLLIGVLPLVYGPSLAYIIMVVLAMIVTRPLRVGEWIVAIIGFLAPYYFLLVILFLTDNWNTSGILPAVSFNWPKLPGSLWITGGILLMVAPFLAGGYFVQDNLNKMLIQVRKCWSLLLVVVLVGLIIILLNPGDSYQNWLLSTIPIAAFHAATYYYGGNSLWALVLHWVVFAFVVVVNYFPQFT